LPHRLSRSRRARCRRVGTICRAAWALIGRERELAQLKALVAAHRLVTVTGPGGVGKSRLVVDAAWTLVNEFPDGVWLVELASLADPVLVPSAITAARALPSHHRKTRYLR
jgi:predicted ATPase